ncbi:MAG: hypothetical protein DF168_01810 [Candidatus Moanabacter tarae]|uniref:Uncharacterized protein n=1 Tax=Candidatus Moanibacter tarae TaxID=2200854 RepID=A0A2Z4AG68_9BACT|nr:MAG: hypothetical protein DF168_01810 [Candidatus Moanabacter tarae]
MDVLGFGISHEPVEARRVKADYSCYSVTIGKCYNAGEIAYLDSSPLRGIRRYFPLLPLGRFNILQQMQNPLSSKQFFH